MGFRTSGDFYNTFYIYIKNLQGDIVGIVDRFGSVIAEIRYDSWGAPELTMADCYQENAVRSSHFGYRGYYYDTETGFYYCNSRYYDPLVKRWINADSVISGMDGDIRGYNGFSYCENNPIIFCDLFGTSPDYSQYGFYYDGSVRDFKRLEQGLPPYSYELFLQNGGYVYPKQKVYEGYGETIILHSIKYDTKEQAEKVLEKKKEDRGITKILNDAGTGLSVAGAFNSSKWISIAGGVIAIAYKIFKGLDDADAYVYESAAKSGNGVFTVTWMYYGRYQGVIEIYYEKLEDIHR